MWNRKEALFLSSVSQYCSQVTLSILLCCPLWVALVLSWCPWCRGEQDYQRICGVSGAGRSLSLAGQYPGGNQELRRLLDRSENDQLWVPWAFDLWEIGAGIVKDPSGVSSNVPDAHPVPERFPEGQQHC